jgi:hypothetical protein
MLLAKSNSVFVSRYFQQKRKKSRHMYYKALSVCLELMWCPREQDRLYVTLFPLVYSLMLANVLVAKI